MVKIAVVPSNQHRNVVIGDPNPALGITTEEMIAVIRGLECMRIGKEQGHEMYWAYVPGAGTSSVDELVIMLDRMMVWKPDFVLSLHSDAGGPQDIYPLVCRDSDKPWANAIGVDLAKTIGFATQSPATRTDLAFSHRVVKLPSNRAVLLEIGEHGAHNKIYGMDGPAALWKYARFHGIMAMRSFLKGCGLLKTEVTVSKDVPVPAGYEKWYSTPPVVTPPPVKELPLLKYVAGQPYMKDAVDSTDIYTAPIYWTQRKLNAHYTNDVNLKVDGIFGAASAAMLKKFQSEHYWNGIKLVASGQTDSATWKKLQAV